MTNTCKTCLYSKEELYRTIYTFRSCTKKDELVDEYSYLVSCRCADYVNRLLVGNKDDFELPD